MDSRSYARIACLSSLRPLVWLGLLHILPQSQDVPALRYVDAGGQPTEKLPFNPNGSPFGIAGITDDTGRLLSQMPHVESDPRNFHPKAATIEDVIGLDVIRGGVQYFG
jgi:phosphoribosylformylglycinamidine (FGAM) synthase-like amidotransferase family enzyme